jgi:hypothetical protein
MKHLARITTEKATAEKPALASWADFALTFFLKDPLTGGDLFRLFLGHRLLRKGL